MPVKTDVKTDFFVRCRRTYVLLLSACFILRPLLLLEDEAIKEFSGIEVGNNTLYFDVSCICILFTIYSEVKELFIFIIQDFSAE